MFRRVAILLARGRTAAAPAKISAKAAILAARTSSLKALEKKFGRAGVPLSAVANAWKYKTAKGSDIRKYAKNNGLKMGKVVFPKPGDSSKALLETRKAALAALKKKLGKGATMEKLAKAFKLSAKITRSYAKKHGLKL